MSRRRDCCCKINVALGTGILNWVPGGLVGAVTHPCVIKITSGGSVLWQCDPNFAPTEIAVDDFGVVYVRSALGSSRINASTGQLIGSGLRPGRGRLLAHPATFTGTYQLEHFGPGSDTLNTPTNLTFLEQAQSLTSNAGKEFFYRVEGVGQGMFTASGSVKWAIGGYVVGKTISLGDTWLSDSGDLYQLGESSLRPGTSEGYLYKFNASNGTRAWVTSIGGCFITLAGDNAGHVYCAGGNFSTGDASTLLQIDDSTGAINWGWSKGVGLPGQIRDIAANSNGVACVGASDAASKNIHYVNSGGSLVWSNSQHPHNPFGGGFNSFGVCLDSSGNILATGERF